MRDFIGLSLYEESTGYFTRKEVVGSLGKPTGLDFNNILNQMEYRQVLSKAVCYPTHSSMFPGTQQLSLLSKVAELSIRNVGALDMHVDLMKVSRSTKKEARHG